MMYVSLESGAENRQMTRLVAFILTINLLLSGCVPAPADPFRVGILPWPGYESLHLAQTLGYIDQKHLRTVELINPSQVVAALRSGTVDAGMTTLDSALGLLQEGVKLQIVLVLDFSHGADALLARPGILDLQQLKGKRIAVENVAVGGVVLDAALAEANLTVADIYLVTMASNEQIQAYRNGEVDAVVTFEPVLTQIVQEGARVLFDSSRIPGRILDVLVVREEMIKPYEKSLRAVLSAHFRALDFIANQPAEAYTLMAPFLGVPVTDVAAHFDRITIPSLQENYQLLGGRSPRLKVIASELATLMLERQLLQHPVNIEHLLQPAFLPSVQYQVARSLQGASQ